MTIFHVSQDGSDAGDGSAGAPWRTITHALESGLRPGDVVIVAPGIYTEALDIHTGGSPAGYVTLKSEVPGAALIRPPADEFSAVDIQADYVILDGFDIGGAQGDGIEASDVHHVQVLDNIVHGSGESGIQFNWSEFILVEGNTTYGNASDGWYSGISIYETRNITGDTVTEGFRTIVRGNVSHDNVTREGAHTDGNGIIIDDFRSTQTDGFPAYAFPTLVEGNLVYRNGGKGIQVIWSDHVTVVNNTAWHNNRDLQNDGTWRGEISNALSSNNTYLGNIAVADPSPNADNTAIANTSTDDYVNRNVSWLNNLTFNGIPGAASVDTDGDNAMPRAADGNLLGVDPRFLDAPSDFRLAADSPALAAGMGAFASPADTGTGWAIARQTTGLPGDDLLIGSAAPDLLLGLPGDDTLAGGWGNDTLVGGAGIDTATVEDDAASYRLVSWPGGARLERLGAAGGEADLLFGMERIVFADGASFLADGAIDLRRLDQAASVDPGHLGTLAQLYAGYLDRAPDAPGLVYWASRLKEGMSLDSIAASFHHHAAGETGAPNGADAAALVDAGYRTLFERAPDAEGRAYWIEALESGAVRADTFMLALIEGAAAEGGSPGDRLTLAQKAELGLHFAATRGLADTGAARTVLDVYDADAPEASALEARRLIDALFEDATDADGIGDSFTIGLLPEPPDLL